MPLSRDGRISFFSPEGPIRFEVPIHAWSARAGSLRSERDWRAWLDAPHEIEHTLVPERVPGISPMKLRRVGRLGNAAIAVAAELLASLPPDQSLSVVTVSELGELETNDALIESIVADAPVSPQRFSASVHNHILGQVCIALDLPCGGGASTAGLEVGMVEALSEMESGHWVLALVFEPRVDEHYAPWCGGIRPEYVIGLLLQPGARRRLVLEWSSAPNTRDIPEPVGLHWLALLTGHADRLDGRGAWRWKHVDA